MVRACRHAGFWFVILAIYFCASASTDSFTPFGTESSRSTLDVIRAFTLTRFSTHATFALQNVMINIPFCYLLVYYLVPMLMANRKYRQLAGWCLLLTLAAQILIFFLQDFSLEISREELLIRLWFTFVVFVNISPPIVFGLFLAIKMVISWYSKQKEHLELVRENANVELLLLQAQVHPHFLFNTLNNIYSFALNKSATASDLVTRLSAVLDYMVRDCDSPMVLLEREIKVMEDYIELEKVRYGNRLDLQMQIQGNPSNKTVISFLFIPFVENSFKHGASEVLGRPWIKIYLVVNSRDLYFEMCNGKPIGMENANGNHGIGLRNVKKRLQLLYPENHELDFVVDKMSFTVKMRVPLMAASPIPVDRVKEHVL